MAIQFPCAASCSTASATAKVEADDHVDFFSVEPLAGNRGTDVGFILVVGEYHLDRLAEHCTASVRDGHSCGDHRARTAQIGVEARLVIEDADFYDVVGYLTACPGTANDRSCKGHNNAIGNRPVCP